jgi:hypothetical protein
MPTRSATGSDKSVGGGRSGSADQGGSTPPHSTGSIAEQLRGRRPLATSDSAVEERIVTRLTAWLDQRLEATTTPSGFTLDERFALLEGLRTLIALIELGDVTPPARLLALPALQALAETLDDPSFYEIEPLESLEDPPHARHAHHPDRSPTHAAAGDTGSAGPAGPAGDAERPAVERGSASSLGSLGLGGHEPDVAELEPEPEP